MVIEVTLNKHDFEENKAEKWKALSVLMGAETAETHLRISNPAELQGVIGPLLSAGKGPELQSLLAKYGVAQMTDLRADQMDLFAADLRAMGAQI